MRIALFDVEPLMTTDLEDNYSDYIKLKAEEGDLTWKELLVNKINITEPGIGYEHILALHYTLKIEKCDFISISKLVMLYFTSLFGHNNILSIREKRITENNMFIFHILAFPLNRRMLEPYKWIEKNRNNEYCVKSDIICNFYSYIEQELNIKLDNHNDKNQFVSLAKIDLIANMEFNIPADLKTELIYDAKGYEKQIITDMTYDKFSKTCNHIITYFTTGVERELYMRAQDRSISPKEFFEKVDEFILKQYPNTTDKDKKYIFDKIYSAVYGNYVLDALIEADDISDIKVLDPKHIRVKCNGKRMSSNITFLSGQDYMRFINSLAIRYGLNLRDEAFHVFTDTTSSDKFILRLNISTPYVNSSPFPYLHIRKQRKQKYTVEELVKMQCMPRHVAEFIRYEANNSSIIFCGKGGSGKTTFMNTYQDEISYANSGLVIQESEEMHSSKHPDFMFQHVTQSKNGMPAYDLKDESRNGLLTDLDYFIISEIKGGEALYFLNAAATGHRCWCSLHAPSTKDAIDKLADYVMYESSYTKEQAMYMLKEMKTIIYLEDFKVKEISQITGWDEINKCLNFKIIYQL